MIYSLRCLLCLATWSSSGEDDPDTNCLELDDTICPLCGHEDFEVIDQTPPEPLDWDLYQ